MAAERVGVPTLAKYREGPPSQADELPDPPQTIFGLRAHLRMHGWLRATLGGLASVYAAVTLLAVGTSLTPPAGRWLGHVGASARAAAVVALSVLLWGASELLTRGPRLRRHLKVTTDGLANDGESGEGDNVVGNSFHTFEGGEAGDTLVAPPPEGSSTAGAATTG